ncbi:hypothetical protein GCE9029_04313 [Grimontia celer]|uniref:Uncharacterized protein n=1 Tax=Grimontia celer TaxID=1796497 RepID=A0A128FBU9_9GAMM|nr:hypothetical protein GCE9029_04313 [Grimontia celer]
MELCAALLIFCEMFARFFYQQIASNLRNLKLAANLHHFNLR